MRKIVIDIECDSLNPSVIWVAVTKDVETEQVKTWLEFDDEFRSYISGSVLIGHNILGFDLPVLRKLAGVVTSWGMCIDTLVLSRLRNSWDYSEHSLEAWGERLGYPKLPFKDFSHLSDEMITYCKRDVEITYKLYEKFLPYMNDGQFRKSIALEHHSAWNCQRISDNGHHFDVDKALRMQKEIGERLEVLYNDMQVDFPPKTVEEVFVPKRDNKTKGYIAGVPFTKTSSKPFNPRSTKDRIERLWEAGWKPVDRTKGHAQNKDKDKKEHYDYYGWKTNETNLATLPDNAPEGAKRLVEFLVLSSRHSSLEEWISAYNERTGRIHGNFNHIGAWTHRKSHSGPNMANIPSVAYLPEDKEPTTVQLINHRYNGAMRSLWCVPKGRLQVGVDAEGIQLRILAHYVNNPEYTEAIVSGKKENETDIHNVNKRALGLRHITRDNAKTFIYAWLLGAGAGKIGEILSVLPNKAREAMENFLTSIDGLSELKYKRVVADAARGYFIGLDGRAVRCDSDHLMLAGYLQNGESVIMKWANRIWQRQLDTEKIWYRQVNDVHDEWQTEVEDDPELAEYVKQVQINSIVQAGEELGVKCPLAGSGSIGKNWMETH